VEGSSGAAEKNICNNNNYNGISVMSVMASLKLTDNLCSDNNGSGIWVGDGAKCSARSNICKRNEWHGISIADGKCSVILNDNQCSDNKKCGIYYSSEISNSDSGNILENNGEFNYYQIRHDLWVEKFDELEQIASKIRREKSRYSNGNWQLTCFYESLGYWSKYKPSVEEKLFKILNDWIKVEPNSITPRIVTAYAYEDYAWHARGNDYAYSVSDEMWKIFSEKLGKAWEVLEEAEKISKNDDPDLYKIFFVVGRGLGKSDEELSYLFDKGITIERGYFPIYVTRANFLLPRWGGGKEDAEKFARNSEEISKDTNEFIYARLAANLVCLHIDSEYNKYLMLNFSYPKIKKGHIELLKKYPESDYHLNTYCLLASLYKDKETAKELFNKIGDNWENMVWHKEEVFKKYKDWAYSDKNEPSKPAENSQQTPKASFIRRWLQKFIN
jgi:parallel beta-helix repeat protein